MSSHWLVIDWWFFKAGVWAPERRKWQKWRMFHGWPRWTWDCARRSSGSQQWSASFQSKSCDTGYGDVIANPSTDGTSSVAVIRPSPTTLRIPWPCRFRGLIDLTRLSSLSMSEQASKKVRTPACTLALGSAPVLQKPGFGQDLQIIMLLPSIGWVSEFLLLKMFFYFT